MMDELMNTIQAGMRIVIPICKVVILYTTIEVLDFTTAAVPITETI
jgi:hypothetical protein